MRGASKQFGRSRRVSAPANRGVFRIGLESAGRRRETTGIAPLMRSGWRHNLRYLWPLHLVMVLTGWLPDNVALMRFRGWLASFFVGSCGGRLLLGRDVTLYNPQNLHLGRNVYISKGGWINAGAEIRIADEVIFGPYCVMSASNHTAVEGSFRFGAAERKPIEVGHGAWIAGHCSVTAGVKIGRGALIAASSAVVRDIPAFTLAGGVPAKPIRTLD